MLSLSLCLPSCAPAERPLPSPPRACGRRCSCSGGGDRRSATPDRRGAGEVNGVFCHCHSTPRHTNLVCGGVGHPGPPGRQETPGCTGGRTGAAVRGASWAVWTGSGEHHHHRDFAFTSRVPRRPDPGTVRLASASLPHRPERETKDQINERPRHGPRRVGGPAARRRQEDARAEMERACN